MKPLSEWTLYGLRTSPALEGKEPVCVAWQRESLPAFVTWRGGEWLCKLFGWWPVKQGAYRSRLRVWPGAKSMQEVNLLALHATFPIKLVEEYDLKWSAFSASGEEVKGLDVAAGPRFLQHLAELYGETAPCVEVVHAEYLNAWEGYRVDMLPGEWADVQRATAQLANVVGRWDLMAPSLRAADRCWRRERDIPGGGCGAPNQN